MQLSGDNKYRRKGGDKVSKRLKTLTASLILACIMIVTLAGAAFAAPQERDYDDSGNWAENSQIECPDRDQDDKW